MGENNDKKRDFEEELNSSLRDSSSKWISGISGGVVSAIITVLFLVIPVVNTWLTNTKEVQILQIKNTSEQVAYITKRMEDSDKERDLYKKEMLECQQELRALQKKINK